MMHFTRGLLLAFVSLALVCGPAAAKPPKPEKPGLAGSVKWNYVATDRNGNVVEKGAFFAHDSKIMDKRGKQVGTYEDVTQTHVKVAISQGKLEGDLELHRDSPTTYKWHGKLRRPNGSKYNITVSFEKVK